MARPLPSRPGRACRGEEGCAAKGWIKFHTSVLANSERVDKLHPAQRWWYVCFIGAAYNKVLPGLLVDDSGGPLSYRSLAFDLRTQHQQIEGAVSACVDADLMQWFKLGQTSVLAIRKYAEFQGNRKKPNADQDDLRRCLWMTFYENQRESHPPTGGPDESHPLDESHPPEIDGLLQYLGYLDDSSRSENAIPMQPLEDNPFKDKERARSTDSRLQITDYRGKRGVGRRETQPLPLHPLLTPMEPKRWSAADKWRLTW